MTGRGNLIVIDYNKPLFVPKSLQIVEHNVPDGIPIDGLDLERDVELFEHPFQRINDYTGYITGKDLVSELKLAGKKPLDVYVLRYLLDNPELIPKEWRVFRRSGVRIKIFFCGTVYYDPGNSNKKCVLYIYWTGSKWSFGERPLERKWFNNEPAAVLRV